MSAEDWPVEVDPTFGCWKYHRVDRDGYAITWRGSTPHKAYRVVYEQEVGTVGEGLVLDHKCRNRACVRPSHMRQVTQSRNLHLRRWGVRVREERCPAGHDMRQTAAVTPNGGRVCRECNRGSL